MSMSTDWYHGTEKKKEPEAKTKRVKVENKIPEVLEKVQASETENFSSRTLSPIVLDLQLLDETDKNVVIKSVILQIPFSGILNLLKGLTELFLLQTAQHSDAITWIHLIILTRIDEIMKSPPAVEVIRSFSAQYQERLSHRTQLLKLRGRTQLLVSQVKAKQRQQVSTKLALEASKNQSTNKTKKKQESIFDASSSEDEGNEMNI